MAMRSSSYACATLALGWLWLGFGTIHRPAAADAVVPLWVDLSSDGLTVYAEDVPLPMILDEIGRVTRVQLRLDGIDHERVSIAFEDVPVEEGLRRLLRGKNFFIVSGPPGSVAQARIFETSPTSVQPRRRGPGVATNDDASVVETRSEVARSLTARRRSRALQQFAANAGIRATADAVVDLLQRESNPRVIERALDIVGSEPSTPLDVVMRLAQSNPEPQVRIKALTHLAQRALSDTRVQHMLHAIVVGDPAPEVRRAAKELLETPRP